MELKKLAYASTLAISLFGLSFIHQQEPGDKVHTTAYADTVGKATICGCITRGATLGMKVTPALNSENSALRKTFYGEDI